MTSRARRWWWLLALIPLAVGAARLRFEAEVLDLLPGTLPVVEGLKLYQTHFANARELIVTLEAADPAVAETAAQALATRWREQPRLVADVMWQPPWLEHPEQATELLAHLWLNQPPAHLAELTNRLAPARLGDVLEATRAELATTMSPTDIARLSYDPFGFTRLPDAAGFGGPGLGPDAAAFASPDGRFRMLFLEAATDLPGYRDCARWLAEVRAVAEGVRPTLAGPVTIRYTGRPAFVAEIAGGMERDITGSIAGTSIIIALLFWAAHRRWKPMLWLLTLLAVILAGTLALGGLIFGGVNVVSLGFAAILLGLAVDYAVVHYQEALAHPTLSIPQVRRAIAPSISWAAITTIAAFLVLNGGGLPGLAQLGTLVGVGVALAALVMIFAFLPPLFPERRAGAAGGKPAVSATAVVPSTPAPVPANRQRAVTVATIALLAVAAFALVSGGPRIDASAKALEPRDSEAYAALAAVQRQLLGPQEPLWLILAGADEREVAQRLARVRPVLAAAVAAGELASFTSPEPLWPNPDHQVVNRARAAALVDRRAEFEAAATAHGFAADALGLTTGLLDQWRDLAAGTQTAWPTNRLSRWITGRLMVRGTNGTHYALALLHPAPGRPRTLAAFPTLDAGLPRDGVWLSGWELLGDVVWRTVRAHLPWVVLPMVALVLASLAFAFRRPFEILLGLAVLALSGLLLLAVMRLAGWSWNLLNLMAVPLILGTGVDYSLFMQLALRRHHGDLAVAHRSVGRALLLCGATAVAGFGSLAWSSNLGMASLGRVCAIGIAGNMLIAVYLLPVWWRRAQPRITTPDSTKASAGPSTAYRAEVWRAGLALVRWLPASLEHALAHAAAWLYCVSRPARVEIVAANLRPVFAGDERAARRAARRLFDQFALKVVDLWRYESGAPVRERLAEWTGWDHFNAARAGGRGLLLVTPHLGNWEYGGPYLADQGIKLLVLTQPEPGEAFTELRRASRARWGIETLVVRADPFAFLDVIKRLQDGAVVALLIDRPPPPTAVPVELFGQTFAASAAAAELARATGCALLPVYVVRGDAGYSAHVLPEVRYDRAALGNREARRELTQQILRVFEPVIRQYPDQWFHFVPLWPEARPADTASRG